MFVIKYNNDYYKQDSKIHTTIRGLSYIKTNKLKHRQVVKEEYPSQANICKILKIYPVIISSLSLEFLKADGEYEGLTITSHEDFCKLINSFIPAYYHQATPDSQKVVIELEIMKRIDNPLRDKPREWPPKDDKEVHSKIKKGFD